MDVNVYNRRNITLHDVCRATGLSTATVSRAINHSPLVTSDTRQRVLRAAKKLGYIPNHPARALARQRTDTLGVVFPDFDMGFYSEVLRGINEVAGESNLHLMAGFSRGAEHEQQMVQRFVMEGRVDALLLLNLHLPDVFVKQMAGGRTPIVLMDRPVQGSNLATITLDNVAGADAAMSHLLGLGYRRIVVVSDLAGAFDAEQRLRGCRAAMRRAGLPWSDQMIWRSTFTEAGGRSVVDAWLDGGQPLPEAIFALSDPTAFGVLDALQERGLSVPDDVAVVGFDDAMPARHLGLTTVRSPMRQMGREACAAAVAMLMDNQPAVHHVLPTELVVRRSCGAGKRRAA